MRRRLSATPLPWLGGLLVVYLVVPIFVFAIHFAESGNRGFGTPGLWGALYMSVVTATISTTIIALLGVPLAYALARSHGRVANVVGVLVLLPLAMPPLMAGILLVQLVGPYSALGEAFGRHLTESMAGIVLAQTFVASPFLVVSARAAFASVDTTVSEHAATLGHRELSRFWRVSVPMAQNGIRAGLVLAWLRAFGEYGATVVLAYHPYTLPVYTYVQFSSTGLPATEAPTFLGLCVAAVVALFGRIPRRRRRPEQALPAATVPRPAEPTLVSFNLDTRLGPFDLRAAYQAEGPTVAVLGPSGSGKSTTLRGIAGLLGPRAGSVHYGAQCVDAVAVEDRRIGYVPQGYGLFPHLTVWQNATFGVGADPGLAAHWMSQLGLDGLEHRFPDELSGGQRQRVSLVQALARAPDVLLLDEPFSALDSPVRRELRRELRRLQRQTGISTVLVTHDPEDAAYLADEVVVLGDGHVLQSGAKREVFTHPSSPQVARLVGVRNLRQGVVHDANVVDSDGTSVAMDTAGLSAGTSVLWCIRPEQVVVGAEGPYQGRVDDVTDLGAVSEVVVEMAPGFLLEALVPEGHELVEGSPCRVTLPVEAVRLWPLPLEPAAERLLPTRS